MEAGVLKGRSLTSFPSLRTDIIPILDSMGSVAPDVHDLLDVSRELNEMLGQIPGMSRMKRRIDDQQEAARRR